MQPSDSPCADLEAQIEAEGKKIELYMADSAMFRQLAVDAQQRMYTLIRQRQEADR